jgi:hypothetical protein
MNFPNTVVFLMGSSLIPFGQYLHPLSPARDIWRNEMSDGKSNPGGKMVENSSRQITTLERREIQSPLLVSLIEGFIHELGRDKAMQVASTAIRADAREAGKVMASKFGGNSTRELLQVLKQVWAADEALEYDLLEQTQKTLSFNVTRCKYVDMYARLGIKEFGYCLSCSRDESFINGFNPHLKLVRTQTIMEGGEMCDFRFIDEGK